MPASYKFIVHCGFKKQEEAFLGQHPGLRQSLRTQYRKAITNPFRAGKAMARIPVEELQGKLYRLYIGGKKGYRFVYAVSRRHGVVMPVWVSPVSRSRLDWDRADWPDSALEYWADLRDGNMDRFEDWTGQLLQQGK